MLEKTKSPANAAASTPPTKEKIETPKVQKTEEAPSLTPSYTYED
jgi:hypothetical protein